PTHLKKGHRFPDSPDIYWSLGEDFKSTMGANPDSIDDRVKLQGYNYVNVALSIIDAIGEISMLNKHQIPPGSAGVPLKKKLDESRDLLIKLLSHNLSYIRGGASLALGQIGDKETMDILEKKFEEEKEMAVKTQIARSILWNDRTRSKVTNTLLEMLTSDEFEVRMEASRALRDVGLGETLTYLLAALDIEEDKRLQRILKDAIFNAQIDNVMPVNY
ncbi:MAG: HEAT repeat domain-containing protein, partial [Spirochaetia bacterium]|nr:HEAT repeat domain-containing protein [Spirochaetia bacterium]